MPINDSFIDDVVYICPLKNKYGDNYSINVLHDVINDFTDDRMTKMFYIHNN